MMRFNNLVAVIVMMVFATMVGEGNLSAQSTKRVTRKVEKRISGSKRKGAKEVKVREPKAATRAKRDQEKREIRREREYKKSVSDNKKRHKNIQTDEVQERMEQNDLDLKIREREKRKKARKDARKPGNARKKYKK